MQHPGGGGVLAGSGTGGGMIAPDLVRRLRAEAITVTERDDPAVVVTRLQAVIVRLVTSDRGLFSRPRYERLMALWALLQPETQKD
jgi:hypothetical protein